MKTLRFFLLCMMSLLCGVNSWAYEFEVDGMYYSITSMEKMEVGVEPGGVKYTGDMVIPKKISYKGREFRVTSIGNSAFAFCPGLTSIDFSEVTAIGYNAFYECSNLTSLDFTGIKTIQSYAFKGCNGLTSVDMKDVEELGESVFENCSNLVSVDFNHAQTTGTRTFKKCENLSSVDFRDLSNIGEGVFEECTGLKAIDFKNVQTIGLDAFQSCLGLTDIDFKNVKDIGSDAFRYCSNLISVDFRNVENIGSGAFFVCKKLASIDLKNVKTIGSHGFWECSSLKSVDLGNVTIIRGSAFGMCSGLTSINLKNVQYMDGDVFLECTGLSSIDLGNVKELGISVFRGCTSLVSVDLKNVTKMSSGVFANCTSLVSVDLQNVKTIGENCFSGCSNLKYLKTHEKEPPFAYSGHLFDKFIYLYTTLQVPIGSKTIYQQTKYWDKFLSIEETVDLGTRRLYLSCSKFGHVTIGNQTLTNGNFVNDYQLGETVTLNFVPNDGYRLQSVLVNDVDLISKVENNSLTIKMDDTANIQVLFERATFTLYDGQDIYNNAVDTFCDQVKYVRNYNNTAWQALYLPFELNYAAWAGNFQLARINDTHQYDDNNDGIADRTVLEVFILPKGSHTEANTPYLIKAYSEGEQVISVSNVLLKKAEDASIDCSSVHYRYVITGTYTGVSGEEIYNNNIYVMSEGGLKQTSKPLALGAFRWYLSVEDRKGNHVAAPQIFTLRIIDENGNITGVETLNTSESIIWPANVYNLQGKLVKANAMNLDNFRKGIYIVNGKIIVR